VNAFHDTTSTILKYVLAEQRRDLMLYEQRLEQANESSLKTAVERERLAHTVATFRSQIAELTAVVADFERLIQQVKDANAEAAELEQARAEVAASAAGAEYVDYAEAADVREIEREMAIEAGDDSELDRQVAEDDARAERNAGRSAHYGGMPCPGCPDCTGYDTEPHDDEDGDL
jgi:small-conductance mechanosensitive channel